MNISYAQNFEDVLLHRSLGHVDCGFYIDVGANDPTFHSVTKRFYELGWKGINIEPSKFYFDKLQEERTRDLNLRLVVSNAAGVARFFEFEGTGLSTTEQHISEFHNRNGYPSIEVEVETATLASICQAHVTGPVHFLKIDVEGGTKAVLEGLDLALVRPWVIVVEATKPMTQVEDCDEWEHLILSQNYEFAYADGLNRFYLALEHADLREKFKFPPNVFDGFMPCAMNDEILARQASEAAAGRAAERVAALEQEKAQLEEAVRAQYARGDVAETRIAELTHGSAALEAALAERAAQVQAADARIAALEQEKADLAAGLAASTAQLQAAQVRALDLERENAVAAQMVAALEARAASAEARLEQETVTLRATMALSSQATANAAQLMREKTTVETTLARTQERLQASQQRLGDLDRLRQRLQADLAEQTERARVNGERADHLETMLRRVAASLSWRITAPLRGWGTGGKR